MFHSNFCEDLGTEDYFTIWDKEKERKKREKVFHLILSICCPIPIRYCWHLQKFDYTKIFLFMVGFICGKIDPVNLSSYLAKGQNGEHDTQH